MSDKRHTKTPYALTAHASKNNAFSRHLSGVPSIFCTAMLTAAAAKSVAQTKVVEKNRAEGHDIGLIASLSKRASDLNREFKTALMKKATRVNRAISFDPDPQASADKQFKLKGKL